MRLTYALLAALLLLALPSRADTLYEVTGTATLTGNNVCGGTCVETIDFTLNFDEQLASTSFGTLYTLTLVGESSTSSGPVNLGLAFDGLINTQPGPGNSDVNYLAFENLNANPGTGTDEIDVWVNENDQPLPFVPLIVGSDMYACNSAACVPDFCPSWFPCNTSGGNFGIFLNGSVTSETRLIATPEPSELGLLALGALLLALAALYRSGRRRSDWIPTYRSTYP